MTIKQSHARFSFRSSERLICIRLSRPQVHVCYRFAKLCHRFEALEFNTSVYLVTTLQNDPISPNFGRLFSATQCQPDSLLDAGMCSQYLNVHSVTAG